MSVPQHRNLYKYSANTLSVVPVVAKPKEPRRNPDGSMQKARSRPIRSGKEAASAAYANLAIRQHIFKMVDRTTLAIMMRLDKASMKSVSDVLYKEIHVSLVSKMSRKPVSLYCIRECEIDTDKSGETRHILRCRPDR